MSKAIIDTTIMVDVLLKTRQAKDVAEWSLTQFTETSLPVYAIKEFREGAFRAYVWLHNKMVETKSLELTLDAIQAVRMQNNLQQTALKALAESQGSIAALGHDKDAIENKYGITYNMFEVQLAELQLYLRKKISQSWRRRRSFTTKVICELDCFPERDPTIQSSGIIDLSPNVCQRGEDCCLARDLRKNLDVVDSLKEALEPHLKKPENHKRSKALSETKKRKIDSTNESVCKGLGDVAFALYCEHGSKVLTTNTIDHEILANALGLEAISPKSLKEASELPLDSSISAPNGNE